MHVYCADAMHMKRFLQLRASVAAPVLSFTIEGSNTPRSGGAALLMNGFNFGRMDYTATASFVQVGCQSSSWTSNSVLRCVADEVKTADDVLLAIAVSSVVGTGKGIFSFDAPVLSHALTNLPHTGHGWLTLLGLNMGNSLYTPSVRLSNVLCSTTSWSASTSMRCVGDVLRDFRSTVFVSLAATAGTGLDLLTFDGMSCGCDGF